tara:strand:- start:240 stop:1091 length:852 start_codon:yes stop_codon:yes gene_type:complete
MINICIIKPNNYIHSLAYLEIAELLHYSVLELNKNSKISYNFIDINPKVKNIIFGAHLLNDDMINSIPSNTIIFNTEQIESINEIWKRRILLLASKGIIFWDYSNHNLDLLLTKLNVKGRLFEIGFQKNLQRIKMNDNKEVDVLFYGSLNNRREKIINSLLKKNVKVKCLFGVYGKDRDDWIGKSKIVLNLHYYESKIFEIVRIFYLLTNAIPIVSEVDENTKLNNNYLKGIKGSNYEDVEKNILSLLENEKERKLIGLNGFNIIKKYPQINFTKSILNSENS